MDSLLASYASSDEEEEEQHQRHQEDLSSKPISKSSEITPKTSSIFPSLPQPKSSSSSLPPPKSNQSNSQTLSNLSSSLPNRKRVIQFKPPLNPSLLKPSIHEDDDDEQEEEEEKRRKCVKESNSSAPISSLKSFFSALPPPKNSLGSGLGLGSAPALGSVRRAIIETDVPVSNYNGVSLENKEISNDESGENCDTNWGNGLSLTKTESLPSGSDSSNWIPSNENYGSYGHYENYGNYGEFDGNYEENYDGVEAIALAALAPGTLALENSGLVESVAKMPGRRRRDEIPTEIIEVKQDELMKNRPREDQANMTGIAFGPSYQPVSTKGKPSKLHKRKHQIGALYFDVKQKAMELAERRSKGFLTKAETQAKYGW